MQEVICNADIAEDFVGKVIIHIPVNEDFHISQFITKVQTVGARAASVHLNISCFAPTTELNQILFQLFITRVISGNTLLLVLSLKSNCRPGCWQYL